MSHWSSDETSTPFFLATIRMDTSHIPAKRETPAFIFAYWLLKAQTYEPIL